MVSASKALLTEDAAGGGSAGSGNPVPVLASKGGIVVRAFRPETGDDEGSKALEAKASQHSHNWFLTTFVKVHVRHLSAFDAKARKFDDSVVLVAVDREASQSGPDAEGDSIVGQAVGDGFICGCICMGIKEAWLHGERRRVGYLFDLRVHEDYQRRGVGSLLNRTVESEARRKGASAIYLTVNSSNQKAREFYDKHGYGLASERALLFKPLILASSVQGGDDFSSVCSRVPGMRMRRASVEELASVVDEALSLSEEKADERVGEDLALVGGFKALCSACPGKLLDAWIAEVDGSSAALALWDGDGTSTIQVERLLLTLAAWRHPLTPVLPLALSCVGISMWAQAVLSSAPSALSVLSGLALLGVIGLGLAFAVILRFVLTRERERARLIAPVALGPRGMELLSALVKHGEATAKQLGFAVSIVNLDLDDPKVSAWQSGRPPARTRFLLKALDEPSPKAGEAHPRRFSPLSFFDPRDMS